jgi:hypothetical protein
MLEHFCEGIEMANIIFEKATWKEIKDAIKYVCLVSTAFHYSKVLKHSL